MQHFIRWVEDNRDTPGLVVNPPAQPAEVESLERQLGMMLPVDLRTVLLRFNGAALPSGTLLTAGVGPGTIENAVRQFADRVGADFLDRELLLPFHRTLEGSLLAFDRSAAPVPDAWPIVDYYDDTGEIRLVHRTFDGWCRTCLADWSSSDFQQPFSLDKYLRQGQRHAAVEPDVASAHATVAHAYKRAGEPELALESYLIAARCVPTLPWCDWEALKLAVLLGKPTLAYEAAARLAMPAPGHYWNDRGTTVGRVAELVGRMASLQRNRQPWMRLLDQLVVRAEGVEQRQVRMIRACLIRGEPLPDPEPIRDEPVIPPDRENLDRWWESARAAYAEGRLRDDDLLLDPSLTPLAAKHPLSELLRIRREF